jgi:hypothetical protein
MTCLRVMSQTHNSMTNNNSKQDRQAEYNSKQHTSNKPGTIPLKSALNPSSLFMVLNASDI